MIYLDYNATTPLLPEVREAMLPYLTEEWGNPSSAYRFGAKLKQVIEEARESVANLIGALPEEIVFTSCATESNNTAIWAALKSQPGKRHIVTSQVEHSAVLNHCRQLERDGYQVTYLPVDSEGLLTPSAVADAITDQTALVSLMWANNETGVLFPIREIARVCREQGILFHSDAAQAVGKIAVNVASVGPDYLTVSGHKIYGPKAIGALYVRHGAAFSPMLVGGHQESGRRGGTQNVALIVGFGVAASLAASELCQRARQVARLRDLLEAEVLAALPECYLNGSREMRLPNTTSIGFPGLDSDAMVTFLDSQSVCVSSGSACLADAIAPSHVLLAMTRSVDQARSAIRFSLSHQNTETEMRLATAIIRSAAALCRGSQARC